MDMKLKKILIVHINGPMNCRMKAFRVDPKSRSKVKGESRKSKVESHKTYVRIRTVSGLSFASICNMLCA